MEDALLEIALMRQAPQRIKRMNALCNPTKKGNEWHFGMKAHIGVDAKSGLHHTLVATAANEHNLNPLKNTLESRY